MYEEIQDESEIASLRLLSSMTSRPHFSVQKRSDIFLIYFEA